MSYSIYIGVPYGGKSDCDATYTALKHSMALSNWQCVEKDGNIQLYFNVPEDNFTYGDKINAVLESRYPSVNSFNCPDT